MMVVNVRVVRAIDGGPITGQMAALRYLVYLGESVFFFFLFLGMIGFLWAAFDARKQAWHDLAAETVVIYAS